MCVWVRSGGWSVGIGLEVGDGREGREVPNANGGRVVLQGAGLNGVPSVQLKESIDSA